MCCRVGYPHLHLFFLFLHGKLREKKDQTSSDSRHHFVDNWRLSPDSCLVPPPALPLTMAAASWAAPTTSLAPAPGRLNASPLSLKMLPRRVLLRAASESAMVRGPFRAQYFLTYPFPRFFNIFLYSMDWAPLLAFENICLPPSP
jgi:hypothetical protein